MTAAQLDTGKDYDPYRHIELALAHLHHVLPGQGPILNFIHHNTLHGYQQMPFEQALAASETLTGICGYLSEDQFRDFYRQERIGEEDLHEALLLSKKMQCGQPDIKVGNRFIARKELYRIALLYELNAISIHRLLWLINEQGALQQFQKDVPNELRRFCNTVSEKDHVHQLWTNIVDKLALTHTSPHPENMLDLTLDQAESWLTINNNAEDFRPEATIHESTQRWLVAELNDCLKQIGRNISLPGLMSLLCGSDVFALYRPQLQRICASALDEGLAAWRLPNCDQLGLYRAWRASLQFDANPYLHELPDWPVILQQLTDDAVETIIVHLTHLDIPKEKWSDYLQRLALELPGWSGYVNWRQQHPEYRTPLTLADYLAIRLTLDRVWLSQICRETWKIEASLDALSSYFRKNLSEFHVRRQLFSGELPEYFAHQAQELIDNAGSERLHRRDWQELSERISTWQSSSMHDENRLFSINNQGWRLFRLAQHLGWSAEDVKATSRDELELLFKELDAFTLAERRPIWLHAYERNYREYLLHGLQANYGRGRWVSRGVRPGAQIVCCMDEREESFRRHLEELNPAVETLGAAGFFSVPMYYQGLDDDHETALCPVVVTPAHRVREIAKAEARQMLVVHKRGHRLLNRLAYVMHHLVRRNLLSAYIGVDALAPFALVGLLGDLLFPGLKRRLGQGLHHFVEKPVATELAFNRTQGGGQSNRNLGFTDSEQADRVEALLTTMGLTDGFAPFVFILAHGSTSLNNPHEAAHDCGACGGRRGGPNARVFAAMANRAEVRKLLTERGLRIPEDTWFVGAQHDTCNDDIIWYDVENISIRQNPLLSDWQEVIRQAQERSALERCRRFLSAEEYQSQKQAHAHVRMRSSDISQVRPEYGHATNASAIIGRRSLTQGLFLDRRPFLISYDARKDPDGRILESILLTAGPVGAGINLEYYFSTVNNDRFGCGTKIPHNIVGLFGVMEGAVSDLRTGLPLQMVEIHEAMRLQIVVEARTEVLADIYHRQASVRELIGGGWVHLSAIDPESGNISVFRSNEGFVPWQRELRPLPTFESSLEYFRQQSDPLPPVLIRQTQTATGGQGYG